MSSLPQVRSPAMDASVSYRALLDVPGFPPLAAAAIVARTAAAMWQLALVLFVLDRFASPALAGLAVFLSIAPGVVVSPLAGALLDRYGRVRLMALDHLASGVILGAIAVLSGAGVLTVELLLVLVAVASLTNPMSAAGARAMFPLLVPRRLWDRSNAVDSTAYTLTSVIGPPLAGVIVALASGEAALAVTAVLFTVAAVILLRVPDVRDTAAPTSLFASSRAAIGYVLRHPTLRGLAAGISVGNLAFGILVVSVPVLARQRFGASAAEVGALWALLGLGGVVAALAVGRLGSAGRERQLVAAAMAGGGVGMALLAATPTLAAAFAAMAVLGMLIGSMDVALFSLRQRRTDPAWYGRAFAVSMHLNYSGVPVGSALAGVLIGVSIEFALGAAVVFALAGALLTLRLVPGEVVARAEAA